MAKARQETSQEEPQSTGQRTRTGEGWVRETTIATEEVPGIVRHYRRELAKKLRGKWSYVDCINIERKSGRHWVSSGIGLSMPEERKGVSPEGGAEEAVAMANEYWEAYQGRSQVRIAVMGHSQSGATAKMLFFMLVDFNDLDEGEEGDASASEKQERSKHAKDVESIAAMDTMRQATNDAMGHWSAAIGKVEKLSDKIVELAEQSSKNWTGMVEVMRIQYEAKKEEREAAAQAVEDERSAARIDMFAEQAIGLATRLAEEYIRGKVGSKVVDGSFSQRLRGILDLLDDKGKKAAEDIVGEEAWQILRDASAGVSDDAFAQLMVRAAATMNGDDPQQTVMQVIALLPPAGGQALMILLNEAGKKTRGE